VVVVGAASRDIAADDPRGWRLGGAAAYCSLAAARLGLRVGCLLGVDEKASTAVEVAMLEAAGVTVRLAKLEHGPVFENIERDGHRRQRWLSKSDLVPPASLPADWRRSRGWLLGPVAGELGDQWASVPEASAMVGLGWQGMLREFSDDGWVRRVAPTASELAGAAGLVCASVDDFAPGTALEDLRLVVPSAVVVLTAGADGGSAMAGQKSVTYAAVPAAPVVDPTGAGDVFLAALMAEWLLAGELATARALRFAAAAGSCAVEGVGLSGAPTRAAVAARMRHRRTSLRA
jgi:sugar/nucleoside kinase (ribokinase family)